MPFTAPRISRVSLGIGYALLTGAGTWFLIEPSQLLHSQMGTVVYGWAVFLVLGGMLCLVGILTKVWIGEFTGLVLLFFGNLAWATVLIGAAQAPRASNTSAKYGLVLIAFALCAFAYRWGEIRTKIKQAADVQKNQKRGPRL
jgi:hypothetical protein